MQKILTLLIGLTYVLAAAVASAQTGAFDFTITWSGPTRVVQGYPVYLTASTSITAGTDDDLAVWEIKGLPAGLEADFPEARLHCCGQLSATAARFYRVNDDGRILFTASPTLKPGAYPIELAITSKGVTRSATVTLTVVEPPRPLDRYDPGTVPRVVPLFDDWKANIAKEGPVHFTPEAIASWSLGYEAHAWYYDGAWVALQLSRYLNDNAWLVRSDNALVKYRQWGLDSSYTGWRVFPDGLYEHYKRTHDPLSLEALRNQVTKSSFAYSGGAVDTGVSRETAYMLRAYVRNEQLGEPPLTRSTGDQYEKLESRLRNASYAVGHLEQWRADPARYMQPFMIGLTTDALIEFYLDERARLGHTDTRVTDMLAATADFLWERAWMEENKAFYYDNTDKSPAPDLNMLIARTYSWLYQQTGRAVYAERADKLFEGGVLGAWLGGGKQFSQNYRLSVKTVEELTTLPPYIRSSKVSTLNVTANSAVVSWNTDKPAAGLILYRKAGSEDWLSAPETPGSASTTHSITLSSLEPKTMYSVQVAPLDSDGARNLGPEIEFITAANPPSAPANLRISR